MNCKMLGVGTACVGYAGVAAQAIAIDIAAGLGTSALIVGGLAITPQVAAIAAIGTACMVASTKMKG